MLGKKWKKIKAFFELACSNMFVTANTKYIIDGPLFQHFGFVSELVISNGILN